MMPAILIRVALVYQIINVTNAKKDIFKKVILQLVRSVILQNALNVMKNQIIAHLALKIIIYIKINASKSVQVVSFLKSKMIVIFVLNVIRVFAKNVKIMNNTVQNAKTKKKFYIWVIA